MKVEVVLRLWENFCVGQKRVVMKCEVAEAFSGRGLIKCARGQWRMEQLYRYCDVHLNWSQLTHWIRCNSQKRIIKFFVLRRRKKKRIKGGIRNKAKLLGILVSSVLNLWSTAYCKTNWTKKILDDNNIFQK